MKMMQRFYFIFCHFTCTKQENERRNLQYFDARKKKLKTKHRERERERTTFHQVGALKMCTAVIHPFIDFSTSSKSLATKGYCVGALRIKTDSHHQS